MGRFPQYRAMRADGLDRITCIRILRELFKLSLEGAKEVTVVADGLATSLGEHEARLVEEVTQAIEESSEGDTKK